MKIAFLVGHFPSVSETFILNQITGLIDLGHDVEIFAQDGNFTNNNHSDINIYNLKQITRYYNIPSNKIIRVIKAVYLFAINIYKNPIMIMRSLNFFKHGTCALSLTLFYLVLNLLNNDFDIIYCHFGTIGIIGAHLKQIGIQGKLIVAFHGSDMRVEKIYGMRIYRNLFKIANRLLVTCNFAYNKLAQFGADPQKITIHSVGIDLKRFTEQTTSFNKIDNKINVLTIARLVEEKGLEYGINAIQELHINNPTIHFTYSIIGEGPLETSLKNIVKNNNLTNIVHFLGPMTQREIIREMNKTHIFLLPSVSESFGVVLLEAQAMGIPIIASNVGGVSEAIMNNKSGLLVPPMNSTIMANKLLYLINNKKIWRSMKKYGRKFVRKYHDIHKLNLLLLRIFSNS